MDSQLTQSESATVAEDAESEEPSETVISVSNLRKEYGEVVAVDDLSFEVEAGSVVGLLGPNGAGKTTTIKMMLGLVVPDSGTVEILQQSVHQEPRAIHDRIGVMFEGSRDAYWRLTVRENLEFFTRLHGIPASVRRDRHDELLERLDIKEKADVPVRKLSRGMKQKVAIANTLSREIDLAVLDEPTLGLDVDTSITLQQELRHLVNEEELAVIITSHDMDVIENVCDRVIIISDGSVLADDAVDNLLEEFESDTYQVQLESTECELSDGFVQALEDNYEIEVVDWNPRQFSLTIRFTDGTVDDLSARVNETGASIKSIERLAPDLEEAFLSITNDE